MDIDIEQQGRRVRAATGFTIIELMIVIAIISIILVIAVPVYQQYTVRAKVGEGLSLASPVLLAVAETYQSTNSAPDSNPTAGLPPPTDYATDYVDSIEVGVPAAGQITITYNTTNLPELAGSNALVFTATLAPGTGTVTWECDDGSLPTWARPSRCR